MGICYNLSIHLTFLTPKVSLRVPHRPTEATLLRHGPFQLQTISPRLSY